MGLGHGRGILSRRPGRGHDQGGSPGRLLVSRLLAEVQIDSAIWRAVQLSGVCARVCVRVCVCVVLPPHTTPAW